LRRDRAILARAKRRPRRKLRHGEVAFAGSEFISTMR
jgi:hypothetical protein